MVESDPPLSRGIIFLGFQVPPRPDDTSIGDDAQLWRRIHPQQISQEPNGELDISGAAFSTREEVSVALAALTNLEVFRSNYVAHSVVQLTAGQVRAAGCTVVRDPLENDPAHALICGQKSKGQLNKTQQDALSRACIVIFRGTISGN